MPGGEASDRTAKGDQQNYLAMDSPAKPDPSRGVFETLLVLDGEPVELGPHLDRLGASLATLYGAAPPPDLADLARERAAGLRHGRLRLTACREDGWVGVRAEATEVDPALTFPRTGTDLRSLPLPGGLGAHKWVDRSALPESSEDATALLHDGGEVLEAATANVFAVLDGTLVTPPLDGRILPGVTRAAVLETGRAHRFETCERTLSLAELTAAEEVFLTNSVRGVEAPSSLDGVPLPPRGPVADLLAAALAARWAGSDGLQPRRHPVGALGEAT